jgi:hypothetical protein
MQSRDPFVYTGRGVHPRESLPNEIRDGAALLAGQISEAGVHGFVKIELRAHHAMYIHRGRLSVNRPPAREVTDLVAVLSELVDTAVSRRAFQGDGYRSDQR